MKKADRDSDYEKRRQKELEKLGYHFIRINPNKIDFNDYVEFGRVSTYIAQSIKKQTEKLTKKSLIDDLSKRLLGLEFKSNHSVKSKCLKWIVKKILPTLSMINTLNMINIVLNQKKNQKYIKNRK